MADSFKITVHRGGSCGTQTATGVTEVKKFIGYLLQNEGTPLTLTIEKKEK